MEEGKKRGYKHGENKSTQKRNPQMASPAL